MLGYVSGPYVIPKNTEEGGYYFDRCIGSKGGSGSSVKVIHAINFYKAISIREWHTSSSLEEYEY